MFVQEYNFNIKQNYGVNFLSQLLVILTFLELAISSNCVVNRLLIKDDAFANMWITQGRINVYDGVENRLHCSMKCERLDACVSFFYNPKTCKCQVNSVIYLSTDGSVINVGAVYFRSHMGKIYLFIYLFINLFICLFICLFRLFVSCFINSLVVWFACHVLSSFD